MVENPGVFESEPAFIERPIDTTNTKLFTRVLSSVKDEEFMTMHRYSVHFICSHVIEESELAVSMKKGLQNVGVVSSAKYLRS